MLDVLNKHLIGTTVSECSVNRWLSALNSEEQAAFAQIKENNKAISLAGLFNDLNRESPLPFKLTAFRSHFRGYCTCQD